MSDELPQGWTATTLRDLVGPKGMFTDGDWILSEHLKTGKDVRLIQLADVGIGRFLDKSQKFISADTAKSLHVTYLQEGDVLISRMADPLARACLFPKIEKPAITAVDVAIARCDGSTSVPDYFMRVCNSHSVLVQAEEVAVGTTRKRISRKNLELIRVPLAPLNEQLRIAAKLEKLLGKVDACQQRLTKIPALLRRFRQSVLAAACSGRLTADWREKNPAAEAPTRVGDGEPPENIELPDSWNWLLSAHAFDFVTSGSRGWARYYADDGPIFLRVGNLDHDSIQLDLRSIQHVRPPDNAEGKRTRIQQGDLLISVTAEVGMVALVEKDIGEAYINQHVALGRPNENVDRRYLAYFLSARNGGQHQFFNLQRGATKVGLGLDDIKSIYIAHPPLAEQQEIVRRVEALFALADQIEARYAKAKAHLGKLTQSILAKAFRGELVPQDPNDEPASVLLERIKKQNRGSG